MAKLIVNFKGKRNEVDLLSKGYQYSIRKHFKTNYVYYCYGSSIHQPIVFMVNSGDLTQHSFEVKVYERGQK